jgi:hypothetical protein
MLGKEAELNCGTRLDSFFGIDISHYLNRVKIDMDDVDHLVWLKHMAEEK